MTSDTRLPIANCKMQIANCRGGAKPRSSRLAPRASRRAITLTEVLISMGILTLGLLGVAALFPVGGFYMQKAEIADRGSAIAQAVMSDITARGMLNPGSWYVMVPTAGGVAGQTFPSDGKYSPVPPPVTPNKVRATFTRPFALTLGEALTQPAAATDATLIGKQFGSAVVIDPMGVAAMAYPDTSVGDQTWNLASAAFPASVYGYIPPVFYATWQPWGPLWPIRRATFRQPSTGWQMDSTMAEHYFRGNDDLATDLPQRDDRPARQNWDTTTIGGTAAPLARQWAGDYSWLVTLSPTTTAARNGLAINPEGHTYDVSVVVFYKRPFPPGAISVFNSTNGRNDFLMTMGSNERAVKAEIVSTGLNGGEIRLTDLEDIQDGSGRNVSAFEHLRTGQWIMLCGPHPNSNVTSSTPPSGEPRFVLNWYQVISVDTDGTGISGFDPATERVVAVRGPEWPWKPDTAAAQNLCVAICRGAVAVHSKTMRLESSRGSRGSGSVDFGGGGNPTTDPPPWVWH